LLRLGQPNSQHTIDSHGDFLLHGDALYPVVEGRLFLGGAKALFDEIRAAGAMPIAAYRIAGLPLASLAYQVQTGWIDARKDERVITFGALTGVEDGRWWSSWEVVVAKGARACDLSPDGIRSEGRSLLDSSLFDLLEAAGLRQAGDRSGQTREWIASSPYREVRILFGRGRTVVTGSPLLTERSCAGQPQIGKRLEFPDEPLGGGDALGDIEFLQTWIED
jgi:hypothetical protein